MNSGSTELHIYGTLWLLTQGETRKTKRVRLFTDFMSRGLPRTGFYSQD